MFLKSEVHFSELVPDFRFCLTVLHVWKASDILDCMKIIGIQELCGLGATGYRRHKKVPLHCSWAFHLLKLASTHGFF